LRKPLLISLLLVLLSLGVYAVPSTTSKSVSAVTSNDGSSGSGAGSPPPTWETLLVGLTPEEAEAGGEVIDDDLERAFQEGYKQGTLDWKPEVVSLETSNRLEKAQTWWTGFWVGTATGSTVTIGLIAGAAWLLGAVSR